MCKKSIGLLSFAGFGLFAGVAISGPINSPSGEAKAAGNLDDVGRDPDPWTVARRRDCGL
ncbi:hypothetical protein AGRO_4076 [Agrobacterium sp. ATCC 31749]|nr:hypothetical protein AGRO_4076 [Agrobacterium sp. ATCC 31749]